MCPARCTRLTMTADPPPAARRPSEVTARAVAFVAAHAAAEALGADLADLSTTPRVSPSARAGLAASPTRVPRGPAAGRAGIGAARRPLAADRRRRTRLPQRDPRRSPVAPAVHRRSALPGPARARWFAFGLLEQTLATEPSAPGSCSVARPARQATGSRSTRWPTHTARASRRGLPLGRARAARVQPVALGTPPDRLDRRHDAHLWTAGEAASPRSPSTLCRSSPHLIGDAEPDVQKALAWAFRSLTVVDEAGHRGA